MSCRGYVKGAVVARDSPNSQKVRPNPYHSPNPAPPPLFNAVFPTVFQAFRCVVASKKCPRFQRQTASPVTMSPAARASSRCEPTTASVPLRKGIPRCEVPKLVSECDRECTDLDAATLDTPRVNSPLYLNPSRFTVASKATVGGVGNDEQNPRSPTSKAG